MAFMFLTSGVRLTNVDANLNIDSFFANYNNSDFFFDRFALDAINDAHLVFTYESEEHIINMDFLEWKPFFGGYDLCAVNNPNSNYSGMVLGTITSPEMLRETARQVERNAIDIQLSEFFKAKQRLETTDGLYYLVLNGGRVLSTHTVYNNNADFFRRQPVYIIESENMIEYSRNSGFRYYRYFDDRIAYIAFSEDAVNSFNAGMKESQREVNLYIAIMGAAVLLSLASMIILMSGAGRRYSLDTGTIHFNVPDRLWLDFSLAVLVFYEIIVFIIFSGLFDTVLRYDNILWFTVLSALFSVLTMLPFVWWVLSFIKRCKAGKFWQHTLIYKTFLMLIKLSRKIGRSLRSVMKSLWAGFPLTFKVILITGIIFIAFILVVITVLSEAVIALLFILLFTAAAAFMMLRFAHRLRLIEQGAKAVSSGVHDSPVIVSGGELGNIAGSINNISNGINTAVTERLKSERMKTELITNVSHDIRTPLTSLITYSDLLKSEGLDHEKAPEYLEVLIQKAARLKTLTDDLFEASKASSGNIDVSIATLDLVDFVKQVLGELDERVAASGMDIKLNLPGHAYVKADGRLLWRVMENLLSNVFKYSLPASRVYVDITQDGDRLRLDIKNISEHPLNMDPSELLERFKRGDKARSGEGSGLGLSIAQSFIELQGGRFVLTIDGNLFKASVFLPAV